jgi:hypothetical protein
MRHALFPAENPAKGGRKKAISGWKLVSSIISGIRLGLNLIFAIQAQLACVRV